jgi:hypothetical protein
MSYKIVLKPWAFQEGEKGTLCYHFCLLSPPKCILIKLKKAVNKAKSFFHRNRGRQKVIGRKICKTKSLKSDAFKLASSILFTT